MLRIEKHLDDIKDERKLRDCFRSALCEVYFKQNKVDYEHIDDIIEWYFQEYKEPIKITRNEKAILESLINDWKYIARDSFGELMIYTDEPEKCDYKFTSKKPYRNISFFNHLFQFITFDDSEPYSIEELLKCEVEE